LLPGYLLEPLDDGSSAGFQIPLQEMLHAYYDERGWDPVTGAPHAETLKRLGLDRLS
jgi:aldehyde:ferredoxin oxidoreductase